MIKYVSILNSLRDMGKLYDKFSRPLCTKQGITKTEMDVLAFLANHPDKDTAKDITEMRMIPKANVSQAVEALIQKGFLTRAADERDRRRIHLSVTAEAKSISAAIHKMQKEFFKALFADFTEQEIDLFLNHISIIASNAENALKDSYESEP